jgi:hypothetical protein
MFRPIIKLFFQLRKRIFQTLIFNYHNDRFHEIMKSVIMINVLSQYQFYEPLLRFAIDIEHINTSFVLTYQYWCQPSQESFV